MILAIFFFISLLLGQLGAFSPIQGVYIYVHDILIGILILFFVLRSHNLRSTIYGRRLFLPIIAFLGAGLLSLVANVYRLEQTMALRSLLYLVRWGYYAMLYPIVATSGKPNQWLKSLFFLGVGFAAIGFVQFFLYPDLRNLEYLGWDPHYYRLFSTLLDPNFAGIVLVVTFCLSLVVEHLFTNKTIIRLLQGVTLIALLLTYSRSSFLALLAAIMVWLFFQKNRRILLLGLVLIVAVIVIPKPGGDTLQLTRWVSTESRINNWGYTLGLIRTSPIVGYGFYALPPAPAKGKPVVVAPSRAQAVADSSLFFVGASTGVIGLASYLWLLVSAGRLFHSISEKKLKNLRVAGFMSLTALLVHSMFANSLFYTWTMIWLWILLGICDANIPARNASQRVAGGANACE